MTPTTTGTKPGAKPAERAGTRPGAEPGQRERTGHAARGEHVRVDPRIEERRNAVHRHRWRRRMWWWVAAVVVVVLGAAAFILLHSSFFSARVVRVEGASGAQAAQVEAAAGLTSHPPLIDVNGATAAAAAERLPWVNRATVTGHWPDGVTVAVTVRRPVGQMTRSSGGFAVVDRTGRVLSLSPTAVAGLPAIQARAVPGAPGSWVGTVAAPGVAAAATLPEAFKSQVTAIVVDASAGVTLQLTSPVTIYLGTATQLQQKYEDAASLLAGTTFQAGDVINVSVPNSPAVQSS